MTDPSADGDEEEEEEVPSQRVRLLSDSDLRWLVKLARLAKHELRTGNTCSCQCADGVHLATDCHFRMECSMDWEAEDLPLVLHAAFHFDGHSIATYKPHVTVGRFGVAGGHRP